MKTTRTTIVLLVAAALAMTWAAPVGAVKPTTETVRVTMTLVDGQGLATDSDCTGGDGPLLMTRDRQGLVGGPGDVLLRLVMNDVVWKRQYPELLGPITGFAGCHGDTVEGSPIVNDIYGGLGINIDRSGAVTDVLWHFDYYLDGATTSKTLPNGKVLEGAFVWTVREYFTLTGNDLDWNPNTDTVSGDFYLQHSLYDADNEFGYEPFHEFPHEMAFKLEIEPID